MWEDQKRSRFQQLRECRRAGGLTEAEEVELARLTEELEAAEANYLTPVTEQLRRERETVETQNRTLEVLALRKDASVLRLRQFLAERGDPNKGAP